MTRTKVLIAQLMAEQQQAIARARSVAIASSSEPASQQITEVQVAQAGNHVSARSVSRTDQ